MFKTKFSRPNKISRDTKKIGGHFPECPPVTSGLLARRVPALVLPCGSQPFFARDPPNQLQNFDCPACGYT